MTRASKTSRILSGLLIAIGTSLALLLTAIALWPDFEAVRFDITHAGGEALPALRCPILITPVDEAAIRLELTNPRDRPINFLVRTNIAAGFVSLLREEQEQTLLQPGESVEFVWPVTVEDAVYGRMILARARVLRAGGLPERQRSCGIMVMFTPLGRGQHIVAGLLAAILLSIGTGSLLWLRQERPFAGQMKPRTRVVGVFVLLILLTMTASLLGWWGSGVLIILFMLLAVVALIDRSGTVK